MAPEQRAPTRRGWLDAERWSGADAERCGNRGGQGIMRASWIAGASAAMALGLATAASGAMGDDPAADTAKRDAAYAAILKAFPTPRLYKVTMTGSMSSSLANSEMCLGAPLVQKLMGALIEHPEAVAAISKGCTQTRDKTADGVMHVDLRCEKAAGANMDSHMLMDGTIKEMRMRMEIVTPDLVSGQPTTVWTAIRYEDVGDCPANMKPGQLRTPDGKISDPLADLKGDDGKTAGKPAPGK